MENKILIFRTSITRKCDIKRIEKLLAQYPQIDKWNVDFEDWEKILKGFKRPTTVSTQPLLQKLPSESHVPDEKYVYPPALGQ